MVRLFEQVPLLRRVGQELLDRSIVHLLGLKLQCATEPQKPREPVTHAFVRQRPVQCCPGLAQGNRTEGRAVRSPHLPQGRQGVRADVLEGLGCEPCPSEVDICHLSGRFS